MKKIIIVFCLLCFGLEGLCETCDCETVFAREHMFREKKSTSDQVIITNMRNVICSGNAFKIAFSCKFKSECTKAGDIVNFDVKDAIYTREGTLLIPSGSKIVGTIVRLEKQRVPNKNARVYFNFNCLILPDGKALVMNAKPATKGNYLKEGPWETAGNLALYSVGLGCIGAGAGVGFSFIPSPAKIAVGLGVGIPVGFTVGLITGLITPGLKYHAKRGECVEIVLCEALALPKCN